jgi:hypothetical protein
LNTTSCSLITTALVCAQYREIRGAAAFDCFLDPVTSLCVTKYPQPCNIGTVSPCPSGGTRFGTCSSIYTTAASCNSGSSWSDIPRLCAWNYGSGLCDNSVPCSP